MEKLKKLFGGINLTWPKVIIMAIIAGIYTAIMAMIPAADNTSFSDLAVTFEVWIFFGIFIIMNSKSNVDSMLKCFVFFLISQPLIYLVQDVVKGSHLFLTYYRFWIPWTVACIPMGFFGYYLKKDKLWGLIILSSMMLFLGLQLGGYISKTMFSFPRHILTVIFCVATLIIYPLAIFEDRLNRITGLVIDSLIIIAMVIWCVIKPPVYSTDLLSSGDTYQFDDTFKAYLKDSKYGDLSIKKETLSDGDFWTVHAELKRAGKTEFILESPEGEKTVFDLTIEEDTFERVEKKN